MPTVPPVIPAFPEPVPTADDPANFPARGDAVMEWFPEGTEAIAGAADASYDNALESAASATAAATSASAAATSANAALAVTGYVASSSASLSISAGAKAVTGLTGKSFANGDSVVLERRSDPTARMWGPVSSANMGAGTMTVTVAAGDFANAGGPYTDWIVKLRSFETLVAATAADIWAGTSKIAAATPEALKLADAFQSLTDAPTVTWNTATQGYNAVLLMTSAIGATRAIGAPSNLIDGRTYTLDLVQPASGGPCAATWNAIWDFGQFGTPTLSTTASKRDKVVGQYNSTTGKIDATFRRAA